jgi:hypothetical protein
MDMVDFDSGVSHHSGAACAHRSGIDVCIVMMEAGMAKTLMASKRQHEHDGEAAMLAYRTGLSAAICKAWIENSIAKSPDAIKAAFQPGSDEVAIIVARSEIEAFALARRTASGG